MSKEKILVHSCCATCAGYVLEKLTLEYLPIIYFFNPNIYPLNEYVHRRDELKTYATKKNISFIEADYQPEEWSNYIKGFENEPEKGLRCNKCFYLRMDKAASYALAHNINTFTTTLTISPHKNSKVILEIGTEIAKNKNLHFLAIDFKKQNGFFETMKIAKRENFYRQNYCGCLYSIKNS